MDILNKSPWTRVAVWPLLLVCLSARAEVYRCTVNGAVVFTDQPCIGATPLALPPPTVIAPEDSAAARAYDRRVEAGRKARDQADEAWTEAYRERRETEARNRTARVAGIVIEGMSPDDVRQVLGSPDEVRGGGSGQQWVYRPAGGIGRTITFRDGAVAAIRERESRRKRK